MDKSSSSNDGSSKEGSNPPTDEEDDVEELPPMSIKEREKTQMSMYNVPYQRASTFELDAYKDRETPQSMKHTKAIHEKYCQLIDRHIGKGIKKDTNMKSPKVPEPKAYYGEEDAEKFEGWYHINRYCGMEHNEDCMSCMALFLEGDCIGTMIMSME